MEIVFKQCPNNEKKLVIIGESDRAKLWVAQLRESSKRVNKGCEHYVLKAFNLWCQERGTNNLAIRIKQAEAAIAKEVADNIAASKPNADGEAIIRCAALLHHVFKCNLKDCIRPSKKQFKDNTIMVHIAAEGIVSQGSGNTFKKAKANAAKAFLRVVNKSINREYEKENDPYKTNF